MSVSVPFFTRSLHTGAWHVTLHTLLRQSVPDVQVPPVPHFAQALVPPQSTSDSPSFFTTSEQVGTWQMLPMHTPLWQSDAAAHSWPVPHFGHDEPQSMSVSVPFFTPSKHVAAWQVTLQTPLVQSPANEHPLPSVHFLAGAQLPPQSTSVSVPFFAESEHVAAWHTLPEQTPLAQSPASVHPLPSAHFLAGAQLPPQSTSVSVPFFVESVQLAAWHLLEVQTPLWQSVPAVQAPFVPHLAQALVPPQSMSDSPSFFTTSEQVGTWQMLPMHTPLRQSAATEQTLPSAHFLAGAQLPPQSTSVSVPFFTPSPQPAA